MLISNLMPAPVSVEVRTGHLPIGPGFQVVVTGCDDARVRDAAQRIPKRIERLTGIALKPQDAVGSAEPALSLQCETSGPAVQALHEDESYRLNVSPDQARIQAPAAIGVLRGLETFLQLISPGPHGFSAAAVSIEDRPRFPWRGFMLDVSRHFMPLDAIYRNLDGMAAVKLNVFHWHLSDDQGFRVESKRYPKLYELGSDGLFYTQDQIRQVIAYARDRGIRVVPEFDMPAHTASWLVGYPELGAGPGPYQILRTWGLHLPALDPSNERVYTFLDGLIGEMAALFPDEYFHIGGDEVNGKAWDASPALREFKTAHGFTDNHALQAYFTRRVQEIVKRHAKRMEGWDEILDPALPRDVVIQSWRGPESLAHAAQLGFDGILSAGYYLDLMHSAAEHYRADPLGKQTGPVPAEEREHILGGEGTEWVEFATPENIDSRIWPRLAAVAERLWSPRDVTDVRSMYRRLDVMSERLQTLGLQHLSGPRRMLERLAGNGPVDALQTLADAVEPLKGYARHSARQYSQTSPLNRLVDAVPPESARAREFGFLVDDVLAGKQPRSKLRPYLTAWRDNDARLKPELARSTLLSELAPLSVELSVLGAMGLGALDLLDAAKHAPPGWAGKQRLRLEAAAKPRAELLLAPLPSIRKLVDAAK